MQLAYILDNCSYLYIIHFCINHLNKILIEIDGYKMFSFSNSKIVVANLQNHRNSSEKWEIVF